MPGSLLIFVLIPLAAAGLIGLVFVLLAILVRRERNQPTSNDYTEDTFFGVKWRWAYPLSLQSVTPFCPTCDTILVRQAPSWHAVEETILYCETCGRVVASLDGPIDYVQGKVL